MGKGNAVTALFLAFLLSPLASLSQAGPVAPPDLPEIPVPAPPPSPESEPKPSKESKKSKDSPESQQPLQSHDPRPGTSAPPPVDQMAPQGGPTQPVQPQGQTCQNPRAAYSIQCRDQLFAGFGQGRLVDLSQVPSYAFGLWRLRSFVTIAGKLNPPRPPILNLLVQPGSRLLDPGTLEVYAPTGRGPALMLQCRLVQARNFELVCRAYQIQGHGFELRPSIGTPILLGLMTFSRLR